MAPLVSIGIFRIDADTDGVEDLSGLATEDLVMAGRGHDDASLCRFLASRRAFRAVLGEVTGCLPAEVRVRPNAAAGPDSHGASVHFSVAHRGEHYVVGAARQCLIGVDIVRIGAAPPTLLVDKVLPEQARQEVLDASHDAQPREFALWWCRITAAVRACGARLDDAARCLALAPQQTTLVGPELAVAVAAVTGEPFDVEWHSGSQAGVRLAGAPG